MNDNNVSVMQSLVSPGSLDDFYNNYFPGNYFSVQGDLERLPELFKRGELDDFLSFAGRYKGPLAIANGEKSPVMTSAQGNAADLFKMGLTTYLSDVEPYLKGATELLRKIEQELGLKPNSGSIGIFASPRGGGLQVHYDVNEIFSIQLKGTKKFNVALVKEVAYPVGKQFSNERLMFDDLYPQSINGIPNWDNANFETVEMKPGTFLYMPKGTWHFTEASDDVSISIGIGFETPSAADSILEMLRQTLIQDESWRKPLYGLWGTGSAHDEAIKKAQSLVSNLTQITGNLKLHDFQLALTSSAEKRFGLMDDDSRFQRVPTVHVESESIDDVNGMAMKTVYIMTRHARKSEKENLRVDAIPSDYVAILNWIETQEKPFTYADLDAQFKELDANGIKEILKIATYSGLAKMLWFPELPA